MMYQLSVLITARNEQFLARTVQDLLEHSKADTEIIIGMDGCWSVPAVPQHPRVTIYYGPVSIGQRAMLNQLCRLSKAKYVCKVDAHCSFDDGWDVKMLDAFKEVGDDVTLVPTMKNLHAFDYVCEEGHRRYQSPSGPCKTCGKPTVQDVVWIAKKSPNSTAYCFDPEPHFQYDNNQKKKQVGDLVETMSLQGSAFMLTREKWWELNVCDEEFGSWGSQGCEVACKTWLSGGRVLCNRRTWYAHLFRTQGSDFGFPYPQSGTQIENAKAKARELFFNNKWPKQTKPLSWLVEKFWPVKGWAEENLQKLKENEQNLAKTIGKE